LLQLTHRISTRLISQHYHLFQIKELKVMKSAVWATFFEALVAFFFKRQTGEDQYRIRGEDALGKMKEWAVHSEWNWKNKLLLMQAEYYNTQRNFEQAVICYEASIKAARESKFVHEEALGCELSAIFFLERGLRERARLYYKRAMDCYMEWGAYAVAKRIEDTISEEFGSADSPTMTDEPSTPSAGVGEISQGTSTKKRLLDNGFAIDNL